MRDDEPNILSSLRRLFRTQGYQVSTAESGRDGLKIRETETVDIAKPCDDNLNERLIPQLVDFEISSRLPLTEYVRTERRRS